MLTKLGPYEVGKKYKSPGRTITEGDYSMIVNVSWENGPHHTDREFMKTTPFGERILGGPCIIPFVAGLSGIALHELLHGPSVQQVALVGIDKVRFKAPLHPGDTMMVETEIAELRPTSKPQRFLGVLKDVVFKQGGQVILEMERTLLLEQKG